jgi:hypothetical protein
MSFIFSTLKYLFIICTTINLLCSNTQAQEKATSKNKESSLYGKITDSQNQLPIPHVEVFISGTTSGCITDSLGNFKLKVPFYPCVMVAHHVSYESYIKPIEKPEVNYKIQLNPLNISIKEIDVSAKNRRKKNLRNYYTHFKKDVRNKI